MFTISVLQDRFIYAVFKVHQAYGLPFIYLHQLPLPSAVVFYGTGGHLLSRTVSSEVPSAACVLTVVFGMGTGVARTRIATSCFGFDNPTVNHNSLSLHAPTHSLERR